MFVPISTFLDLKRRKNKNPTCKSIMKNLLKTLTLILPITLLLVFCLSSSTLYLTISANLKLSSPCLIFILLLLILYSFLTRPKHVFLVNYACYKPPNDRKCSYKVAESFARQQNLNLAPKALEFMRNIYIKSGLGDETYAPSFIFEKESVPTLKHATQEAREGIFSSVDRLLRKTLIHPSSIDVVVVTCGSFSPNPSLCSLIVNRYKLKPGVKTYNLSGMGCGSGVISIDFAARVLRGNRNVKNALVVVSENITLNWYNGEERSMLVTNCIFRVGCVAAIVSSDSSLHKVAKMKLLDSLRTHYGADDGAFRAAYQEEDEKGNTGISLTKDLIRVAALGLRDHIKILGPRVLPMRELVNYIYSVAAKKFMSSHNGEPSKPTMPDFTKAFDHICIHTGGKAVIENVARVLKLSDKVTEPARMSLHRFGNTSSSLVFYELAYFEAKRRAKKGDKMWMLAFGTGFKVGSLVWEWLQDSTLESDNPWIDCIQNYPLKAW